ncbi:phosphotransferase family protein [Symbioplanes lichenis]|uniref:phosphotransferase family protein n=1 Tax=Symbioplanes lichenis TaxID=1629072 RepID=UPI002738F7A5|nr:phosphotransferase [Actinoplanes lichenis]
MGDVRGELPAGAVEWVAEAVGGPVIGGRRLTGGTHAVTHLLTTGGVPERVVLRCFPAGDPAPGREGAVLAALDGLGGLAPRLVAEDPAGERLGVPAVLTTVVPGRADITVARPVALGAALARLHAVPVGPAVPVRRCPGAPAPEGVAVAGSGGPVADGAATAGSGAAFPDGTAVPVGPAFRDGMVVAGPGSGPAHRPVERERLAGQARVLSHFDYWCGNVLWEGDRVSGIVDWSGACVAPRGFDVGWCRLDLVLLFGVGAAGEFLAGYEAAAGVRVADVPAWDRFALANAYADVENWTDNYRELGRPDLTPEVLRARHTAWSADRQATVWNERLEKPSM